ncbi:MarR family winged helix-turn-helix transcriptional regulator [Streptomyces sp. PT12]|uniref:MarR family winged helix-turn-helix transcriptional regulator n=1 Tax=Streptomyces sp. PT12 TaxID=1510197 RepID=UPI000DE30ECC|nr:MarR family transcriptional regulator [Streptomyces sp. PT12]RBM20722.1 MarR family transcriptional regulator [Streptomyces sp. PT12]
MTRPVPGLAQSWCALSTLHDRIEAHIERALQAEHALSAREFSVLTVLDQQPEGEENDHFRMNELADALSLSQSATTRLVNRLEDRGLLSRFLCPTDRRGIYTDVTDEGRRLLAKARPTNDAALSEALAEAERRPVLAPLVEAVRALDARPAPAREPRPVDEN